VPLSSVMVFRRCGGRPDSAFTVVRCMERADYPSSLPR
jgi:hypothetical protein